MKIARSMADLAINGSSPLFEDPLHVGRPNVGSHGAISASLQGILDRGWLTNNGPLVRELESTIAKRLGVKHCVAMCNGTIALEIAIRALRLDGEVIVPAWTFIATAHALSWQGITPVFADIDADTHCLDPASVERMITPKTSGIIGVHLWGRPAPINELSRIADEHGLELLFDAAHAFDCSYEGTRIGNFGRCEVFSFHATKVFNTFEGGAICTNDDEIAETARLMRNFGFQGFDNVIHPGTNGKMPEINAAMGLANLVALPTFIDENRRAYDTYRRELEGIEGLRVIEYTEEDSPNYQYVVLQVEDRPGKASRDEIIDALSAENVLARKYFWPGCHRMKPYRDLYPHAGLLLPATELSAVQNLVLPTGASVSDEAIASIASVLKTLRA